MMLSNTPSTAYPADIPFSQVAIIMRTRDRPLLLARALSSVLTQTFADWRLFLVNDGGSIETVERTVAPFRAFMDERLVVLHNETSIGMEAASNKAIRSSRSSFVVIHDDDDSWHPEFLAETTAHMQLPEHEDFCGIVTWSELVLERIEGHSIHSLSRRPYNCWYQSIDLQRLLGGNLFAPISYLFRRKILDEVGMYDETFPVLGDWEFNIRCALQAEIAVLPKILAYYHQRPEALPGSSQANSVQAESNIHQSVNCALRNKFLRGHLSQTPASIGTVIANSHNFVEIIERLNAVEDFLSFRTAQAIDRQNQIEKYLAVRQEGIFERLSKIIARQDRFLQDISDLNEKVTAVQADMLNVAKVARDLSAPFGFAWVSRLFVPFNRFVARFRGRS